MGVDWLAWSNPVAVWWGFLLVASGANITALVWLHRVSVTPMAYHTPYIP